MRVDVMVDLKPVDNNPPHYLVQVLGAELPKIVEVTLPDGGILRIGIKESK